jgi:hypothetical protein
MDINSALSCRHKAVSSEKKAPSWLEGVFVENLLNICKRQPIARFYESDTRIELVRIIKLINVFYPKKKII